MKLASYRNIFSIVLKSIRAFPVLFLLFFSFIISASGQSGDKVFLVLLNINTNMPFFEDKEAERLQKGHLENIRRLFADGQLLAAGPFEEGGGIFILQAGSIMEAQEILQSDPAVKAGRFSPEILPVNFLKGKLCRVNDNYDVSVHHFLRLNWMDYVRGTPMASKDSLLLGIVSRMEERSVTKVVAVISSSITSDGFIILEGGSDSMVYRAIDLSKLDDWDLDYKKLWVASGIFCQEMP